MISINKHIKSIDLLRNLYEANWIVAEEIGHIGGHSNTRYSLSEPLYDIILKYLINYFEQVEHSLKEVEAEFSTIYYFEHSHHRIHVT